MSQSKNYLNTIRKINSTLQKMIITAETPRLSSTQEPSGGGAILSVIGISLLASLIAVAGVEYLGYRAERMQREKQKTNEDSV